MRDDRIAWLKAASQVSSFRQMYALACRIADSSMATDADRFAARRVVNALSGIIDKPIAKASKLAKARRRFAGLVDALRKREPHQRRADASPRRQPVTILD